MKNLKKSINESSLKLSNKELDELIEDIIERIDDEFNEDVTWDIELNSGKTVVVSAYLKTKRVKEYSEPYQGHEYSTYGLDIKEFRVSSIEVFDEDGEESYEMSRSEIHMIEKSVKE